MKKYILIDELGMSNSMRAYTDSELEALVDELIEIKSESDPSFIVEDKSTEEWLRYFNYEVKEAKGEERVMSHVEKLKVTVLEIVKREVLNILLAKMTVEEACKELLSKDYRVELLTDRTQAVVSVSDSDTHYKVLNTGDDCIDVFECEHYNEQMEDLTWESILYINEEFWGDWFEIENNGFTITNIGRDDVIVTADDYESLTV